MRSDVSGVEHAPQSVVDLLVRLGGKNPFSEPNYRVVLAQNRVCQQAAEWHDWDDSLSVNERGGMVIDDEGNRVQSPFKPDRIVKEMRVIPRYPICDCTEGVFHKKSGAYTTAGDCDACGGVKGWIIERWLPAHVVAPSEEEWNAQKVEGTDLPRLGPYPHRGEYVRIPNSRATERVPSAGQLEQLLFFVEWGKARAAMSREQYILERTNALRAEREKRNAERKAQNAAMIREHLDPLVGSSLRAGAERERYAQQLRDRGHQIGFVGN